MIVKYQIFFTKQNSNIQTRHEYYLARFKHRIFVEEPEETYTGFIYIRNN